MTERNPYHLPAGTEKGGQFTSGQLKTIEGAARKAAGLGIKEAETYGDIKDAVRSFIEKENEMGQRYENYGIRFEDKKRNVGDKITEKSMHNPDREDEREFPKFGSKEYKNLEELGGASAWRVDMDQNEEKWINAIMSTYDKDVDMISQGGHLYIIGGNSDVTHSDADPNEIVIGEAIVLEIIF